MSNQQHPPGPYDPQGQGPGARGGQPPWQPEQPPLDPSLIPPASVVDPLTAERERGAAKVRRRGQRRTAFVAIGVTALLAGTITAVVASQKQDDEYAQVCYDKDTEERVADANCEGANSSSGRTSSHFGWYFFPRGSTVPAIGSRVSSTSGGTTTVPSGARTAKNFASTGGTVSRGGFGTSAKSSSGGSKSSGG